MGILDVKQLRKTYSTSTDSIVVLDDVTLCLERGENVAIMGPSGSGKSTLLHVLGTLETPTSGSVRIDGVDPFRLPPHELASFRHQKIGFIFQDHHLLPQLSLIDNLLLPALATRAVQPSHKHRANELLEKIGLSDRRHHLPSELSGGQRERAAVARAMMMKPAIILADEPTGNLDQMNAKLVVDMLLELQREENAILIAVTHSHELASRMNRSLVLRNGRLLDKDSP